MIRGLAFLFIAFGIFVLGLILSSSSCDRNNAILSPPEAPRNLEYLVSSRWLILKWKDNANDELGFWIQKKTPSGDFENAFWVGENKNSYSISIFQITPNPTYRIVAWGAGGYSQPSNEVTVPTYSQAFFWIYLCPSWGISCSPGITVLNGECQEYSHSAIAGQWYKTDFMLEINSRYAFKTCSSCISNCSADVVFDSPPAFLTRDYYSTIYSYCHTPCNPPDPPDTIEENGSDSEFFLVVPGSDFHSGIPPQSLESGPELNEVTPSPISISTGKKISVEVTWEPGVEISFIYFYLEFLGGFFEIEIPENETQSGSFSFEVFLDTEEPAPDNCIIDFRGNGVCYTPVPSSVSDEEASVSAASPGGDAGPPSWVLVTIELPNEPPVEDGGTEEECPNASRCCTQGVKDGILYTIERISVPDYCECPPETCFLLQDIIYKVNLCGCVDCGGCD